MKGIDQRVYFAVSVNASIKRTLFALLFLPPVLLPSVFPPFSLSSPQLPLFPTLCPCKSGRPSRALSLRCPTMSGRQVVFWRGAVMAALTITKR